MLLVGCAGLVDPYESGTQRNGDAAGGAALLSVDSIRRSNQWDGQLSVEAPATRFPLEKLNSPLSVCRLLIVTEVPRGGRNSAGASMYRYLLLRSWSHPWCMADRSGATNVIRNRSPFLRRNDIAAKRFSVTAVLVSFIWLPP